MLPMVQQTRAEAHHLALVLYPLTQQALSGANVDGGIVGLQLKRGEASARASSEQA